MDQKESARVESVEIRSIPVLQIRGYFDEAAGLELNRLLEEILHRGKVNVAIDFSACPVINSMGMSLLLEAKDKICQDYRGKLVLAGLKAIMKKAFDLAEITPTAVVVETIDEAVLQLGAP